MHPSLLRTPLFFFILPFPLVYSSAYISYISVPQTIVAHYMARRLHEDRSAPNSLSNFLLLFFGSTHSSPPLVHFPVDFPFCNRNIQTQTPVPCAEVSTNFSPPLSASGSPFVTRTQRTLRSGRMGSARSSTALPLLASSRTHPLFRFPSESRRIVSSGRSTLRNR